jgi:signal transduction histidine kinase/ActR/RegA family two-component response regulator
MIRAIRRSVQRKLILAMLATSLVSILVMAVAMVFYDLSNYKRSWVNDLSGQARILARASAPALNFDDRQVAQDNLALLSVRPRILAAAIYAPDGTLFATYAQAGLKNPQFPRLPEWDGYRIRDEEILLYHRIEENNEILGTVYLRARYEMAQRLRDYLGILGGVVAGSLLIALLMSTWLQAAITKPILAIAAAARNVMERRDFSTRVPKTTDDEIGDLVEGFNDMLTEVGTRAAALEASNSSLQHEMMERLSAEQALLAADRRKDEFLATLAHELRNPLAPLRNGLQIMRVAGDDARAVQMAREMMERQLQQMVRLVDDLLDVSRITTGKLALRKERVELHTVVRNAVDTVRPFIEARRHRLNVELPPEQIVLQGDATRLAQVFANLLNNAAKYTDSGGSIRLQASVEEDEVVIEVADDGIGIAPDMLPAIFEMFTQVDMSLERSQAGLGVGLTLAKHLVDLHGGEITAHSDGLGKGSTFTVRLPAISTLSIVHRAAEPRDVSDGEPRHRILVVDDNVDFVDSLATLLRSRGHDVRTANDGPNALEVAATFAPTFAFLDIGLPKMSGYELAQRMRSQPPTASTVLIAVTGWGQNKDRQRAREAGFDHHLVKPVDFEQVEALVRESWRHIQ